MFGLGYSELLIISLLIIMLFGSSKLPQLGRSLGEAIRGFKKSINDDDKSGTKKDQLS